VDGVKTMEKRTLQYIQLAAMTIVALGCYEVLDPFIPAILFAGVVCISTWPLYIRLRAGLWRKSSLAALLMVALVMVLVIAPSALLATNLANNVTAMVNATKTLLGHGQMEPPAWLRETPLIGGRLDDYWHRLAYGGGEAMALLTGLIEPARNFLLSAGKAIGQSVIQMVFAAFIGFFFYRDGEALTQMLRNALAKLAGGLGDGLLTTIHQTAVGVVHGIFGTALAQAIVAVIGFLIAGIPGAFLLGAATFFLSVLPVGPPLLWGGAAAWLLYQGSYGWAIFMILWGVLVISSIDSFVKPYLISRSSSLPLLLITLGVFGGIIAFGFIGIFIGPPILAVGLTLVRLWTAAPVAET
jgi:predicted PurR-regulated permease PerM